MLTFDGPNKLIILSFGTTELDVRDCFSRWKDWVVAGNAQFLPAFDSVGGNDIDTDAGTKVPPYLFLLNGWKIRPQEASHTLRVTSGIILVNGGGDPFVDTIGSYVIRVNYQQPVQAISSGGGSGGLSGSQDAKLTSVYNKTLPLPADPATETTAAAARDAVLAVLP